MPDRSLTPITRLEDIPADHRGTPIARLLEYHNLGRPHESYTQARILIGMCMDHRKSLRIPPNFAYILRDGGANLRASEFKVSYAIGVGGVRHIALIAHDTCGMVNLLRRRDTFVAGMIENAGWDREAAEEHFAQFAPFFEIGNEIDFVRAEAERLRQRYPRVTVVPMAFQVADKRLYLVPES